MSSTTNTAIRSVSISRKAIRKYFIPNLMLSQLDRIQIGVISVVSRTKYRLIPSIPRLKWQKLRVLNSCTNWYCTELESNSPHSTIDRIKFTIDVIRAICFISVTLVDDSSLIGRRISEPIIGIKSRADSIVVFDK